jgi:hypothetical protein
MNPSRTDERARGLMLARRVARMAFRPARGEEIARMHRDLEGQGAQPNVRPHRVTRLVIPEGQSSAVWFCEVPELQPQLILPTTAIRDDETPEEAAYRAGVEFVGIQTAVAASLGVMSDSYGERYYFLGFPRRGQPRTPGRLKRVLLQPWDATERLGMFDRAVIGSVHTAVREALHRRSFHESEPPTDENGEPLQLALNQLSIPIFNPMEDCYTDDKREALQSQGLATGAQRPRSTLGRQRLG